MTAAGQRSCWLLNDRPSIATQTGRPEISAEPERRQLEAAANLAASIELAIEDVHGTDR